MEIIMVFLERVRKQNFFKKEKKVCSQSDFSMLDYFEGQLMFFFF